MCIMSKILIMWRGHKNLLKSGLFLPPYSKPNFCMIVSAKNLSGCVFCTSIQQIQYWKKLRVKNVKISKKMNEWINGWMDAVLKATLFNFASNNTYVPFLNKATKRLTLLCRHNLYVEAHCLNRTQWLEFKKISFLVKM